MASQPLPGFGLPLNPPSHLDDGRHARPFRLFPSLLHTLAKVPRCHDISLPLVTLRELTMMRLMNEITDRRDWHKKIYDKDTVTQWKSEMLSVEGTDVSERMANWCIEELRYKAQIFEENGAVSVYTGDVVKSDIAVPFHVKEILRTAVAHLEATLPQERVRQPDSGEQILDLVDPSLYPLVYGKGRILPNDTCRLADCVRRSGEGVVLPVPPHGECISNPWSLCEWEDYLELSYSQKFQWLPCEVDISNANARITSYINNLHPVNQRELYATVEQIIDCIIPLWNMSLTPLKARTVRQPRIRYEGVIYDPAFEDIPENEGPQKEPHEEEYVYMCRRIDWYSHRRRIAQPEPPLTFMPFQIPVELGNQSFSLGIRALRPEKTVDLRRDYSDRGLQVILKLVNMHLTPDKPEYRGGDWRVEGQLNEHICACAIYCYESVNVTTSRFAFRKYSEVEGTLSRLCEEDPDSYEWINAVFGCDPDGPPMQDMGNVDAPEGRLLVWPNILLHRVEPFRLADPSKPGHQKLLVFFLVDPNIRIISTANVPCQRRDWWSDAVCDSTDVISNLPAELREQIFEQVDDFPINSLEAGCLRLELVAEQRACQAQYGRMLEEKRFPLREY